MNPCISGTYVGFGGFDEDRSPGFPRLPILPNVVRWARPPSLTAACIASAQVITLLTDQG